MEAEAFVKNSYRVYGRAVDHKNRKALFIAVGKRYSIALIRKLGITIACHAAGDIAEVNRLISPTLPGSLLQQKEPWYEASVL